MGSRELLDTMRHRPVIGIPTQTLHSIEGISESLPASWVMSQRYFLAATSVGAVPWMIPLLDEDQITLREIYDRVDGILLPGGVDMDPCTFGEAILPACGQIDPARDRVEIQLTRWAVDDRKPVLGLCRGLQVINVALGGTLYQDLQSQKAGAIKHDYFPTDGSGYQRDHLVHDVALADGSRLRAALGRPVVSVNSMHHQGIRDLAPPLVAAAIAPDGLVEGVESRRDQFLVGVQWHPEVFEATDPSTRQLFRDFIAAAVSRRG